MQARVAVPICAIGLLRGTTCLHPLQLLLFTMARLTVKTGVVSCSGAVML